MVQKIVKIIGPVSAGKTTLLLKLLEHRDGIRVVGLKTIINETEIEYTDKEEIRRVLQDNKSAGTDCVEILIAKKGNYDLYFVGSTGHPGLYETYRRILSKFEPNNIIMILDSSQLLKKIKNADSAKDVLVSIIDDYNKRYLDYYDIFVLIRKSGKLLYVLNKSDLISESDKKRILELFEEAIPQISLKRVPTKVVVGSLEKDPKFLGELLSQLGI